MDHHVAEMANQAIPVTPSPPALCQLAGQQRVLAALQQDVVAGKHLLCMTGPPGSGKTVLLHALKQQLEQGLVGLIEKPTPGRVLIDMARALRINAVDDNEPLLRRQLVIRLSMATRQNQPIILLVDDADSITTEDLNLLVHFFPPGHATIILAGAADPEAWQADCMSPSGRASFDRICQIEPLSVQECAAYIRHRLRENAMPENRLQPADIDVLHRQVGGIPGRVNLQLAEALAKSSIPGGQRDTVRARTPAAHPAPVKKPVAEPVVAAMPAPVQDISPSRPSESGSTSLMMEAECISGHKQEPKMSTIAMPQAFDREPRALSRRERRLRRSARLWRATALLSVLVLAALLTRDLWIDHIPLDRTWLERHAERFPVPLAYEPPALDQGEPGATGDPDTPATSLPGGEAGQDSGFAPLSTRLSQAAELSPSATDDSVSSVTIAPHDDVPSQHLVADTALPVAVLLEPVAQEPVAQEPVAQEPVAQEPVAQEPVAQEPVAQEPVAQEPTESPGDTAPPPLSRAQREQVARLYAERAEYEWSKGELASAVISIQRGLSTDPDNPRLLDLRARLRGQTASQ